MSRFEDPIFVIYVDVSGVSRSRAEQILQKSVENAKPILGTNNIYIPIRPGEGGRKKSDNSIELLWPGNKNMISSSSMGKFTKVLDGVLSILYDDIKNNDFKDAIDKLRSLVRDLKIDQIDELS